MKRPQGFERQIEAGRGPVRRSSAPSASPGSARDRPSPNDRDVDTDTEPITVVASSSTQARARDSTVSGSGDASEQPAEVRTSERADRRAVARAARARRRYERAEIRRFTRRSRRRILTVAISVGSVVVLALAVVVAAFSPLMAVTTIDITGTSRVDASAVESSLESQIGTPLTLVDGAEVARSLSDFPLIRSYSIESRPPHTLVVHVVEREPVGIIEKDGVFTLVDAAGVTIEAGPAAQAGYPTITTPTGTPTGRAFESAARVLLALPTSLDGQISAVTASTADDVTLTLVSGGATIFWGSSEQSGLKALVLSKLMASTDPTTVNQYDVSSPETAVTR